MNSITDKRRFPIILTLSITFLIGGAIFGAYNLREHGSLLPIQVTMMGKSRSVTEKVSSFFQEAKSLRNSKGEKVNIVPWSHENLRRPQGVR